MKKPWIILLLVTGLLGTTLALWRRPLTGAENTIPCHPSGPPETNCVHDAILHISTNVTISPAAPAGAPYHSIVCVGDTITASGSYLLISNAVQEVRQNYSGTGTCPPDISYQSLAPASVTLGWSIDDDNGVTNGVGSSVAFTRTNGTSGFVSFGFHQITMPANSECGAAVPEGHDSAGKTFAFVEVGSLAPEGTLEIDDDDDDPRTRLFAVCAGPDPVLVFAESYPDIATELLPACWNLVGGTVLSKKVTVVEPIDVGAYSVIATASLSSRTATIIGARVHPKVTSIAGASFRACLKTHP
jgi:hypothetical protein